MLSKTSPFFFNDTATTEIYTLSLHDALPILLPTETARLFGAVGVAARASGMNRDARRDHPHAGYAGLDLPISVRTAGDVRSGEHTSELQSLAYLVCRLLLHKKKTAQVKHAAV